jgi:methylmalonyl-CoA/ethylmalonyl-CoA epimerase
LIRRLSHLGFAVRDLEQAIRLYQDVFGLQVEKRWTSDLDRMSAASMKLGEIEIELMQPWDPDSPLGRFIARRGEGIHHVSYEVGDVAEALDRAREAGLEAVNQTPRPGGEGRARVAFLHPKSVFGVLTELQDEA